MIRRVLVPLGFILGLLIVLLIEGKVSHLSLLPERWRPALYPGLDPDAGLLKGRAAVLLAPDVAVSLQWRLEGVGLSGPRFAIQLSGAGVDLAGTALLAPDGQSARLQGLGGTIDLAGGLGDLAALPLRGLIAVSEFSADLSRADPYLQSPTVRAVWSAARMDGADLGRVGIDLAAIAPDGWRADLTADGPALVLTARAQGTASDPVLRLDGELVPGVAMPPGWARWADQTLGRTASGWTIALGLSLRDLIAPPD